jgi:hypothetical protein
LKPNEKFSDPLGSLLFVAASNCSMGRLIDNRHRSLVEKLQIHWHHCFLNRHRDQVKQTQQSQSVFDRVQVPLIVIAETVVCLGITKGWM